MFYKQLHIQIRIFLEDRFYIFFNIIFLLVLWEFHVIQPDHTHFPVLPCPPPYDSPTTKQQPQNSSFHYPYTH